MTIFDRRSLLQSGMGALAVGATLNGFPAWGSQPLADETYLDDFDELWTTLGERYAFLAEKHIDWNAVRTLYRPMAKRALSDDGFCDIVRRVLGELYDAHTHLWNPLDGMPRWPLYDLLVEGDNKGLRIAAIAAGSAAEDAGLSIGERITHIAGQPVEQIVQEFMPRCLIRPDPIATSYASNVAVAGRNGQARHFTIAGSDMSSRDVQLLLKHSPPRPDVEWRRLDGGFGYIAIRSFSDITVAEAFDQALANLQDTAGLIIDVRENGGGDTAVARPIMGRFITARHPYAIMRRRAGAGLGAPWTESVDPRGPFTYTGPVVVLTSHWSASMAEGFPMGMRDIGRAMIVGTPMMGLGAAVFPIRLDRTGIAAQYSAEPVYDTQDRPRSHMRPDVEVLDGHDILSAGIAALSGLLIMKKKSK